MAVWLARCSPHWVAKGVSEILGSRFETGVQLMKQFAQNNTNPGYVPLDTIIQKPQQIPMFLHISTGFWGRRWYLQTSEWVCVIYLPCKPFDINLKERWLHERYSDVPSTCSEPGGKWWQRLIRGFGYWHLHCHQCTETCARVSYTEMINRGFTQQNTTSP